VDSTTDANITRRVFPLLDNFLQSTLSDTTALSVPEL
jgi:hypothetical protein